MRYTYEFKKHCIDLYRKGQYPKTPEGISQRGFRMMVRRWCRNVEIHGFKVLKHKKRNRVWTTEERFELVNHVLSGESFTSVAISAGICPGGLNTWIHKYKEMGYIGLIDRRKNRKPKESHLKKHKHPQPGRHKESEHEELIRLRSEVDTVIVNGEIVVEKGRLLRIDEWQKSAYADEIGHELLQRASKHFPSLQEEIISSVQECTGGAL